MTGHGNSEDVWFTIKLRKDEAQGDLNQFRDRIKEAGEAAEHHGSHGIKSLDDALHKAHQAGRQFGGGLIALEFAFGDLASEAGKTVKEIAHVATALAFGGPWVAAFTVAALAVGALVEALREAHEGEMIFGEAVEAMNKQIERQGREQVQPMINDLASLEKALRDYGKTSRQVMVDDAMFRASALQGQQENIERNVERLKETQDELKNKIAFGASKAERDLATEQYATNLQALESIEKRGKNVEAEVETANHTVAKLLEVADKLDKLDKQKASAEAYKKADHGESVTPASDQEWLPMVKWARDSAKEQLKIEKDKQERLYEMRRDAAEETLQIETDQDNKMRRLDEEMADWKEQLRVQEYNEIKGYSSEALGIATSAGQQLVDGMITGQKDVLAHTAAALAKAAGSAMISHGIDAASAGIAQNAILPGSGVVALATGLALIGGGMALGGLGTGIEHSLAGGRIGSALPDKSASTSTGVNGGGRGGSGGGDGSGHTITNVFNYGIAGPSADETARQVAKSTSLAGLRGFNDNRVQVHRG